MRYKLGSIEFDNQYAPKSWGEQHTATYAEIPLVSGVTALQKTGDAPVVLTLSAFLHFTFVNVEQAISALEGVRSAGLPVGLSDATGAQYGDYVLRTYTVTRLMSAGNGRATAAEVAIDLLQYVELDPATRETETQARRATALSANRPTAVAVEALPDTLAGTVVKSTNAAASASIRGQVLVEDAAVADTPSNLTRAAAMFTSARESATAAADAAERLQGQVANAEALRDRAQAVADAAQLARNAAAAGDLTNATSLGRALGSSTDTLQREAQSLSLNLILRRRP